MNSFLPPNEFRPLVLLCLFCTIAALVALHLMVRARARRVMMENALLRRFAEASFEGLFVLEAGKVVDTNSALCVMLGCEPLDIIGKPIEAFFASGAREVLTLLQSGPRRRDRDGVEMDMRAAGGQRRRVQLLARPLSAHGGAQVAVAVREAPPKPAEPRVHDLAHTDPLTGLANRFLLQERLTIALEDAERTGSAVAVLSIDLDHLHEINNVGGRQAGDAVIVEVARRLRGVVRPIDTVARVGGDEFVIVAPLPKGPNGARPLAERIIRRMTEGFQVGDEVVEITASVGIALYPTGAVAADVLLKQADMARNRAKQEDRGGFRCFIPVIDVELPERRVMAQALRDAVARDEFVLHYQPMVNAQSLSVASYEALLRWKRPEGGFVAPGQFIPVAEACGAMPAIGRWVLETACAEAASWPDRPGVSLNLSIVQLQNPDLPDEIAAILERTGLPASRLELEVSERLLVGNIAPRLALLRDLQDMGIRIALDDFGSGTASLRHLRAFPFDRVKIHRSFVIDLGVDPNAESIVRGILEMARDEQLDVTAAGVETEQQLAMLRAMRCNHLQGFLLGRPGPASGVVRRSDLAAA